MEALTNKNSKK